MSSYQGSLHRKQPSHDHSHLDDLRLPKHEQPISPIFEHNLPPPAVLPSPSKAKSTSRPISAYIPLFGVVLLFPMSTFIAFIALMSVPLPQPLPTSPTPRSLSLLVSTLSSYTYIDGDLPFSWTAYLPAFHLLFAMTIVTLWKHAWSVPGAMVLNVVAGSIWGGWRGTIIMTVLTAAGSLLSTLISRPLSPWIEGAMPRAVQVTKAALDSHDIDDPDQARAPWARLSILRLIGVVPWSGLNIASGIVRVPLLDCFIGALIGCAPWSAVTCQVGDILNDMGAAVNSGEDTDISLLDFLKTWDVSLKLVLLTLLSLLPLVVKAAIKPRQTGTAGTAEKSLDGTDRDDYDEKDRKTKWRWSFPRRSRSSSSSSSSSPGYDEEKLALAS